MTANNQTKSKMPNMANPRATRFVFEIAGNPATTPTKFRQLGAVPFFLMGPDHPLFLLLPDALNTTDHAPKVGVSVKDVMYLILGGVALAPEVANGGIHFIIDPIRLTRFFRDIDAQLGAAYIPIHGSTPPPPKPKPCALYAPCPVHLAPRRRSIHPTPTSRSRYPQRRSPRRRRPR